MAEALKHLSPEALLNNPGLHRPFLEKLFDTGGLATHISVDATGHARTQDSYAMAKGVQEYLIGGLAQIPQESQNIDPRDLVELQRRRNQVIEDVLTNPDSIPTVVVRLSNRQALIRKLALEHRSDAMAFDATAVVHNLLPYLLPLNRDFAYLHKIG